MTANYRSLHLYICTMYVRLYICMQVCMYIYLINNKCKTLQVGIRRADLAKPIYSPASHEK